MEARQHVTQETGDRRHTRTDGTDTDQSKQDTCGRTKALLDDAQTCYNVADLHVSTLAG